VRHPIVEGEMVQLAGSSAFCGAAVAFLCMGDPILGFLCGICALVWAAARSEVRQIPLPRRKALRRL
jgi:hypothetical protein